MPDPTTHAASIVAGASAAAGTFLGVEYSILGIAFLGAVVSHIWLPKMLFFRELVPSIFASFSTGVVAGKLFVGMVLATLVKVMPWLENSFGTDSLQSSMAVAFMVAFLSQKLAPLFLNKIKINS